MMQLSFSQRIALNFSTLSPPLTTFIVASGDFITMRLVILWVGSVSNIFKTSFVGSASPPSGRISKPRSAVGRLLSRFNEFLTSYYQSFGKGLGEKKEK